MTVNRFHGKDTRVYLGSRDLSGDIRAISPSMSAGTPDATTFASAGWKEEDPGLFEWQASFDGFYDKGVAGGFGRQLEDLLGAAGGILSIYEDKADGVGDPGWLGSDSVLTKRSQPIDVGNLVKLSGALTGQGKAGMNGKLLHPLGTETATNNTASLDNLASSANGGRGNLHVTTVTGSGNFTVKIQHSANNTVWADLITFTVVSAITSQTVEVAGTVNQYLRVLFTKNSGTSIAFVAGFARY